MSPRHTSLSHGYRHLFITFVVHRFPQAVFLSTLTICVFVMFFNSFTLANQKRIVTSSETTELKYFALQPILNRGQPDKGHFELPPRVSGSSSELAKNEPQPSITFTSENHVIYTKWAQTLNSLCNGRMKVYANEFARLSRVVIDKDYCKSSRVGGDDINSVINQPESAEYYDILYGCFQMDCDTRGNRHLFRGVNYLNEWSASLKTTQVTAEPDTVDRVKSNFTIAITRHEYANLYHTMTDWYNAFIVMKFFNKLPNETNILFIDAHPRGHFDGTWTKLFNQVYFLSEMPTRTLFTDLVWGIQGYNSLIKDNFGPDKPPFMEDFRSFFLSAFGVNDRNRTLNCSSITITFLWRHDYVAHPRNPSGVIQRKIDNEEEILNSVRRSHPDFIVRGVQIDSFSMDKQLKIIADTDVLIGMHGAGLTHVMFLPSHSGMVEMFPGYYRGLNHHMGDLARWRGVNFIDWHSTNVRNDLAGYKTRLPSHVINWLIDHTISKICNTPNPPTLNDEQLSGFVNGKVHRPLRQVLQRRSNIIWSNRVRRL